MHSNSSPVTTRRQDKSSTTARFAIGTKICNVQPGSSLGADTMMKWWLERGEEKRSRGRLSEYDWPVSGPCHIPRYLTDGTWPS